MNNNTLSSLGYFRSSSVLSGPNSSNVSGSSTLEMVGRSASSAQLLQQSNHGVAPTERIVFAKYNIQPIRIKSLLMTRILEGYHAKRYGHNTQDHDKGELILDVSSSSSLLLCTIYIAYKCMLIQYRFTWCCALRIVVSPFTTRPRLCHHRIIFPLWGRHISR